MEGRRTGRKCERRVAALPNFRNENRSCLLNWDFHSGTVVPDPDPIQDQYQVTAAADGMAGQACRSGVATTRPSSASVTLIWHDRREFARTS